MGEPFVIKDCALISIATGHEAQNLRELSNRLETIHPGCIYFHFWGGMLRSSFDEPEYQNDFAAWAWRSLHDSRLAERLAIIDPSHHRELDELRRELLDVIEERLAESEFVPWARAGQRFKFIRSQILVFDTGIRIVEPREMAERIARMSQGSIFYHFIDARRRTESGRSDFVEWLTSFAESDHDELIRSINAIDPYFTTLAELRRELAAVFGRCLIQGGAP
jgi:hypothetical protein